MRKSGFVRRVLQPDEQESLVCGTSHMKMAIVGGGPADLQFSILMKKAGPGRG